MRENHADSHGMGHGSHRHHEPKDKNDRHAPLFVFGADDGEHGRELWITDGTADGTRLVEDIHPGTGSSEPFGFVALGDGRALFDANDGVTGSELWITDGTADGTRLVEDIFPGFMSGIPTEFVGLGDGRALFSARDPTHGDELWISDGTADGTRLMTDIFPGSDNSNPSDLEPISPTHGRHDRDPFY